MERENTILRTEQISRSYGTLSNEFYALKDVSLDIFEHKLTILRGKSGSGKTTLINLLGALDQPTEGKIYLMGNEITGISEKRREQIRREELGFIFQSVSLIPMMNAYENVEFALRLAGIKKDRKKRVEQCLKMVGLANRMYHMPNEMSGGEQQRVAIARAIVHRPRIIFADEPTAELDSMTSRTVVHLFKELVEREGITIVMTTHDIGLMGAGDVVFQLEDGGLLHE